MKAISPTGAEIIGTAEVIEAVADISPGSFTRNEKGELEFEYAGYTNLHWNSQKTRRIHGERVFVDENSEEWPEDQIKLVEADDE